MKIIFIIFFVFLLTAGSAAALDQQTRESGVLEAPPEVFHMVQSVCIEGHVFVEAAIISFRDGASVSLVQVYEEKNGSVVPKRCD